MTVIAMLACWKGDKASAQLALLALLETLAMSLPITVVAKKMAGASSSFFVTLTPRVE